MIKNNHNLLDPSINLFIKAVSGRKAERIVAMDVRGLTSVADAFIICSGRSSRQVTAIADFVEQDLKKQKIRPLSVEGKKEGQWVLLDYGHVIIHIFYDPIREVFDLEGLWADAKRLEIENIIQSV